MTPRTILVTGAAGWIGSHVTRAMLDAGNRVVALVRPHAQRDRLAAIAGRIQWVEADLNDAPALGEAMDTIRPDVCVHVAWYTVPGRYLRAPENLDCVQGSINLMRLLSAMECRRFVGVGTCFEYDVATATSPLAESAPVRPQTLYAGCKLAVHAIAQRLFPAVAWARVFYLYGPGEAKSRLVSHVIDRLVAGADCDLTSGTQVRDYLHVADAATALTAVALSDARGPVNIASGIPVTVAEIASTAATLLDARHNIRLGARAAAANDPSYVVADVSRLRNEIGWRPRFDLRSGLVDVISHHAEGRL